MEIKKILFPLFVFLCMGMIFYFSHQNGIKSESLSDGVAVKMIDVATKVTKKEVSKDRKEELVKNSRFWVRKSAHFTIYLLLGVFVYFTLRVYASSHPILYTILFCFCYACGDEIHQLFVSKRDGKFIDVLIDMCGASLGTFFSQSFYKWYKRKKVVN